MFLSLFNEFKLNIYLNNEITNATLSVSKQKVIFRAAIKDRHHKFYLKIPLKIKLLYLIYNSLFAIVYNVKMIFSNTK